MEKYKFIRELINELILEGFNNKKENFKDKNITLKTLIDENVHNEKFPNIISYKALYGGGHICGFYTLFYTINYLKYIFTERNIYYLYKNTLRMQFFKFYKKFLKFFISKMTSLEAFEIEELNKGSSLERHHLDFILNNNLLFEYLGKKYNNNDLLKKYTFEFEWFDFISNNFCIFDNIDKLKKLNNIFNYIKQCNKGQNKNDKIIFLYIGLTEHWILVIYDSFYKNNFIEMDSYLGTKDIINMKYLDNQEIEQFIKKTNDEIIQVKRKPLSKYQIKQFKNSIEDTQRVLYKLNNILLSNEFSLEESIMEEKCFSFLENFKKIKFNKDDDNKLEGLKIICDWFGKEYLSKWLKEDFFDIFKKLGINKQNCKNTGIQQFFDLIEDLKKYLSDNIKLIKENENDIIQVVNETIQNLNEINNL